jgi:hypothetical protein
MRRLCVGMALIASCGPLPTLPGSATPQNQCPAFSCSGYQGSAAKCVAGRCVDVSAPVFWLTVQIPRTSFFAESATFAFSPESVRNLRPSPTCKECFVLPNLTIQQATYVVLPEVAGRLGISVGAEKAWIPIRARVTPYVDVGGRSFPASSVGLPFGAFYPNVQRLPGITSSSQIPTYVAALSPLSFQPSDTIPVEPIEFGRYQLALEPEGKFEQYYPPVYATNPIAPVDLLTILQTKENELSDTTLDPNDARTIRISSEDPRDLLTGYRVYLRGRETQERVSVVKTMTGNSASLLLSTRQQDVQGLELVVEPPEGDFARPRLVTPTAGASLQRELSYPALPRPVVLKGIVSDPGGLTVVGTISFFSEGLTTLTPGVISPEQMQYDTTLRAGLDGSFTTVLPPGIYRTVVTPDAERLGRTTSVVEVQRDGELKLTVKPRVRLEGTVVSSDGRPFADATVALVPGARLLRRELDVQPGQRWPTVRFPRPAAARTNLRGFWFAEVDEGDYDLTVNAPSRSGFPNLARPVSVCTQGPGCERAEATQTLDTLRVPPPVRFLLKMRTPFSAQDEPLSGALVRAFEFRKVPGDPGVGAFVELASGIVNPNGEIELLLEPKKP